MTDFAEGSESASELMPRKTPEEFYNETLRLAVSGDVPAAQMLPLAARAYLDDARKAFDPVTRPAHYAAGAIECIDAIKVALAHETDPFVAYCRGNVMKYNWRTGKKGNAAEDLRKAAWYANKAAEHLEATDAAA